MNTTVACVHYLVMKIHSKFKNSEVISLYYMTMKAYIVHDFNKMFYELNVQEEHVASYLRGIKLE